MKDTSWLTSRLPMQRPIVRRTEADFYGASDLIASRLGYPAPPPSIASWKHGVTYEKDLRYPQLTLTEGNRATRHLVANADMAAALAGAGYLRVHPVGVPYVYVDAGDVARVPATLLVMPAHSLHNSTHGFDEDAYADQIASIAGRFDAVVACIAPPCIRKGAWTGAFEKRGIPWIPGADSADGNALRRLARIFATCEFVTSNTLGSHIAYAAYSGCKVSLWGPFAEYKLEQFRGIPWYERRWRKLADLFDRLTESHVRSRFPWLFADPWTAQPRQEWAKPLLGEQHKRSAQDLARLLGWTTVGRAEHFMHRGFRKCARLGEAVAERARPNASTRAT